MAVDRRRPQPGLVHHSDQGSQYVSLRFGQRCRKAGIEQSMGSKGDCLRQRRLRELLHDAREGAAPPPLLTHQGEARHAVFDCIEAFYNRAPAPLHARLPLTRRIRKDHHRTPSHHVSAEAGELHSRTHTDSLLMWMACLSAANIPGPYVVAGHSVGGAYALAYAMD